MPEMPMAKATGMPMSSSTAKAMATMTMPLALRLRPRQQAVVAQGVAQLQQGRRQQQGAADRDAHRHPGVADAGNALEAARPAKAGQHDPRMDRVAEKADDDDVAGVGEDRKSVV